ncbi:MAG: hypothetical protein GWP19_16190 [Planctomycetia bacterium]|nr:hypothetical protein [Planctomycetia bacterium]
MIHITENILKITKQELPATYDIIVDGNLTFDDRIKMAFISGSRGPSNCYHPKSDIDISLVLDQEMVNNPLQCENDLSEIIGLTVNNWNSSVEIDIALLFAINSCDFECFYTFPDEHGCKLISPDCFGIYKIQKGFDGFVPKIGVDVDKVFPIGMIWSRV